MPESAHAAVHKPKAAHEEAPRVDPAKPDTTPEDSAVAVSLRDLRTLLHAASSHADGDQPLTDALAKFTDL